MDESTVYVPAGAWMRRRLLPRTLGRARPRLEPEWDGLWHLATGDVLVFHGLRRDVVDGPQSKVINVRASARCGHSLIARDESWGDLVVADERPAIDTCVRCLRLSGVNARWVVRRELVFEGGAS